MVITNQILEQSCYIYLYLMHSLGKKRFAMKPITVISFLLTLLHKPGFTVQNSCQFRGTILTWSSSISPFYTFGFKSLSTLQ
ncbi:hypothetical protein L6452_04952 [Arctium lappa]|uniref:Uncharacterized protein n=1 Tax=Arctium lappa TaxID=4217 RepID=A0ACB9EFG7_ARCLA|nr:hypothetical protein L6452_04952 [Arctium lappa]